MTRFIYEAASALFVLAGLVLLVAAGDGNLHISLLGLGLIAAAGVSHLDLLANQQRNQEDLLEDIAGRSRRP